MKYFVIIFFLAVSISSCKKDFLQRNPQSAVTSEQFFKSPQDLETYTNGLYDILPGNNRNMNLFSDIFSDNLSVYTGGSETDIMIRGSLSPETVKGWDNSVWGQLRSVNFLINNAGRATGDPAEINHYTGIARFFRAYFYYNMIKRYGDVPWYSSVLESEDENLYKAKDPRTVVVDSVMNDLRFAAENIKAGGTNARVTRWAALTMLARTALHEGTFRKYHDELGLQSSADAFLHEAADATNVIMNEGGFSIYRTSGGGEDFRTLFSSSDLSGNPEVIFLRRNNKTEEVLNLTHYVLDWQWALSRSLEEEFLMQDGTPFTSVPGHDQKTFVEVFEGRDPRLGETIMPPGFTENPPGGSPFIIKPNFGGYLQVKFFPRDPSQRGGNDDSYTDIPVLRYAEVLLINAEAKAELEIITQADIDNTINVLRNRVNMPPLNMTAANGDIDPVMAEKYPMVNGANKGVILEIRRERRVETACEGLRFDDLYRWKAGELLSAPTEGIYVPALGAMDVTGDGEYDIAILKEPGAEGPISGLPDDVQESLIKYYLNGGTYYLSEGDSGFIRFTKDQQQPRDFQDKYYYFPIPLQETLLNTNLTQPQGW
jgi:hypothetical protein